MIPLVAPHYTVRDADAMYDLTVARGFDDECVVRLFEEEFAEYVGCVGAVAVNSGTNALVVALKAIGVDLGEEVWVPSFSCRALLDAIAAAYADPFLLDSYCDVKRADFGFYYPDDAEDFNQTIVAPHMFGVDNDFVLNTEDVQDITLSLGAVDPPPIGVCSFHRDKMISTGRGGIIVAQDQAFLDRCRELAYYDQPSNGTYRPAFSFGMTAMQAALGRSQLRQLPGFIERRKDIAARYTDAFSAAGIECPDHDIDSVYFRYIIGTTDPEHKVAQLAGHGIECGRGVNPPLHRLLGLPNDQFPGAEECFAKLLSVPVHPGLTDEQVGFITEQVKQVCAP